MADNKKLSKKLYRTSMPESTHLADSRETYGAKRAMALEDGTNRLVGPVELVEVNNVQRTRKTYDDFSSGDQLLIDIAIAVITPILATVKESFLAWFQNKIDQSKNKCDKHMWKTKAEQLLENQGTSLIETTPRKEYFTVTPFMIDVAFNEYKINMTSEEAKKELFEIFVLSAMLVKKYRTSHMQILLTVRKTLCSTWM